jgi:hypothetical protein
MQRGTLSRQNSDGDRSSLRALSELDDEDEEEVQAQVATSRNDSPSAALPMDQRDLERGLQQQPREAQSWRDWAQGLVASLPAPRRREEVDRDR